jgi:NTE family protein
MPHAPKTFQSTEKKNSCILGRPKGNCGRVIWSAPGDKEMHVDYLLIGGGLASVTAAEALRDAGATGSILILSDEDVLPYSKPPLSKQLLRGSLARDKLFLLDQQQCQEKGIEVLLGSPVVALHPHKHVALTARAEEIQFGRALIATGASAVRPQAPGADLEGIFHLRTLADADGIRQAATHAKRAVVVGASFLGLEVAATLTQMGIAVTLVDQETVLLGALKAPKVSDQILQHVREHEVTTLLGEAIAAFHGDGHVTGVLTQSGAEVPCDLVVAAIGVAPNTGFLAGSGIAVEDGVLVDEFLRSNQPDIFAAGDVANIIDPISGSRRRIEHWDSAVKQGRLAAKNMLGAHLAYDEVSYFYCRIFDFGFEFLGQPDGSETLVERGSLNERSCALIYVKEDVPKALFAIGRPVAETKAIEALIRHRVNLRAMSGNLSDPTFALEQIPSQTVLILQGGGAIGAFECGVVRALEDLQVYPDIVAGVSIGAFNGAIIASNPRRAAPALKAFWNELAIKTLDPPDWGPSQTIESSLSSWYCFMFGAPRFFRPRWFNPVCGLEQLPLTWTSFYDPSPAREIIARYVDFPALKKSPVRLLISAVDVETAELRVFDSYSDDITADHILASGSLPPAFPWTTIDGKHYWDGGIFSNSPLEQVVERCGVAGKRVIVVDLFANARGLPANMMDVLARRDEIVYAERVNKDVRGRELIRDFQRLVEEMLGHMEPDAVGLVKQWPRYIQLMGSQRPLAITRIVREGIPGESPSRDYDFSLAAVESNIREGFSRTMAAFETVKDVRKPVSFG